ncbi:MAG: CoA transferase [Anaerolineales bacterium]|nr:CoA transferase [Anaerolineales bacterium]
MDRNKESLALNLKTVEAKKIFYKLTKTADVVLKEFRPEVTRRLGVDNATLSKINPKLIYCSISGYGQDGPYRDLPRARS